MEKGYKFDKQETIDLINNSWQAWKRALKSIGAEENSNDFYIDHVAATSSWKDDRVGDFGNYIAIKDEIRPLSQKLEFEEIIPLNQMGRPVIMYRLREALVTDAGEVSHFEIIAPRKDRQQENGLDHVEIVTGKTVKEFTQKYGSLLVQNNYCTQEAIDITVGIEERGEFNPHLATLVHGYAIKFHKEPTILTVENEWSSGESPFSKLKASFAAEYPGVLD